MHDHAGRLGIVSPRRASGEPGVAQDLGQEGSVGDELVGVRRVPNRPVPQSTAPDS